MCAMANAASRIPAISPSSERSHDRNSLSYVWEIDGALTGYTSDTLEAPGSGSEVVCLVTPDDGTEEGATVRSNGVTIDNTIPTVADVTDADEPSLGRMIRVAAKLAEEEGIDQEGYRLIINCRDHAGQEVFHVHLHLLGGRPLGRMLSD